MKTGFYFIILAISLFGFKNSITEQKAQEKQTKKIR